MQIVNRASIYDVALETTLLVHGVPGERSKPLYADLVETLSEHRINAALVGIVDGAPVVGMTGDEFDTLLGFEDLPKVNSSNLGVHAYFKRSGATTVSATMELAHHAGVAIFATGGIGGVHKKYGTNLDVSSDLTALARFPVAVISSGVKSILDVRATREALETLGVPVVGFRTDVFPAFYTRSSDAGVDARFDDAAELAEFVEFERGRTGRGVLIANPIPEEHEIEAETFNEWNRRVLEEIETRGTHGRAITPTMLRLHHEFSGGKTLSANIALMKSNADLAGRLASVMRELELRQPVA